MKTRSNAVLVPFPSVLVLRVLLLVALVFAFFPGAAPAAPSYVDPQLSALATESLPAIVTAGNAQTAAQAVWRIGGQVTADLWLIDAVAATIPASRLHRLALQPGVVSIVHNKGVQPSSDDGWVTDFRFPVPWDGTPDVQPTNSPKHWQLVYPVSIDIGADVLHRGDYPGYSRAITGKDVTVAVIDSGVYFSREVRQELGARVARQFVGQIDFVGDGACPEVGIEYQRSVVQHDGYCWSDHLMSRDLYGHGSHVAGILWSHFVDDGTRVPLGVAPETNILSVRVLGDDGYGTYADAIEGIQFVIANKDAYNIRVANLSLSAAPTTPYFVDPLNRAVEQAWASGLVVVAAAGNGGPGAESISVPGNDPYVITVGALNGQRTPGYWTGDNLPTWSATGPTLDGFVKPDVLAPGTQIVSFMYNDHDDVGASAHLVQQHPDYAAGSSLFRMNGTSMATAVTSGVVAMMLEAHPDLTPDQVKYRLAASARPAITQENYPIYNMLQQGMGRVWAPEAVLGEFPADARANQGMDLASDLAHGWATPEEIAHHYQGPVRKVLSDDGQTYLYFVEEGNQMVGLGAAQVADKNWVDWQTLANGMATWSGGDVTLGDDVSWAGGISLPAGMATWSGGMATWSGGMATWSGGMATWSGGMATWSGGMATWSGGMATWSGNVDTNSAGLAATIWVDDGWTIGDDSLMTSAALEFMPASAVTENISAHLGGGEQLIYLPAVSAVSAVSATSAQGPLAVYLPAVAR